MLHPRELLPWMPAVTADENAIRKIQHGNPCNLPEYSAAPLVRAYFGNDSLLAVCRRIAGTLFAVKVNLIGS